VVVAAPVVVPVHDNRADGVSVERMLVIAAQREDEELRRRSNTHAHGAHNPSSHTFILIYAHVQV
jgi:hypothetical protein